MNPLLEIRIKNFKSFTEEVVKFNEVTCFVGANESGKTNLLDAIYHLASQKQSIPFDPDELRIGAPDYPTGEIEIEYTIKLTGSLIGELLQTFPDIEKKLLFLTKIGKPGHAPVWEGSSNILQRTISDIVQINNKRIFVQSFRSDKNQQKISKQRSKVGWFINDSSIDLRKKPYKKLLEEEKITLLTGKEKINFINDLLKDTILKNIKLYQWEYKEENFLQETVPIADFIQNPSNYRSVTNMFIISGWKKSQFTTKLQNQTSMVYANLLDQVERAINSLIKNHWSSHRNLQIKLKHAGDHLAIHLHEPGSSTPPEFRSDGLKWFLTFLINFRAQSRTISNYILLIDEPGLYLHPRGQKDVLEELEVLSRKNQIIYTTHQTFLINKNKPEGVRIISRATERRGKLSTNPFYASKVDDILDPKNIFTDRLLREALGFKVSDISPINEKNILVEGVFDREIFHIIDDYWQIVDLNETSIISCGRASEIKKHATLYKSNDLKIVCFYDSDDPGKSAYKNNDRVSKNEKRQLRDFKKEKKYETLEDLISDKTFNVAYQEWAKKWNIPVSVVKKPKMKSLEKYFSKDKKVEMKHDLENILILKVKEDLKKNDSDFQIFRNILEDLKSRL